MQCVIILPDNLTTPTKIRRTHLACEMTTSIVPLYFIAATCFGTFLGRTCYLAFGARFIVPCFALGFFGCLGRLGEDTSS
jgi:hypothetical protein